VCNLDYTHFKGVYNYNDVQIATSIENNLKYFLDNAFLQIGAWTNVNWTGYLSSPVGNPGKLSWVNEQSYTNGQVWQGIRKDWAWETGVSFSGNYPIAINSVTVSGISITGGYYVDYPQGRVIFNTPISTSSNVYINYSYRNVQTYIADEAPWLQELQYNTQDSTNTQFTQDPRTGNWSIGSFNRIQLPAIILQVIPRAGSYPYEMGNGSLVLQQDVLFHVLSEKRRVRNDLMSVFLLQNDRSIYLFDENKIKTDKVFPINYRGEKINNLLYSDLVSETGYRDRLCRFTKCRSIESNMQYRNLYDGMVLTTLELVFDKI
jgi:hypothetical protein